MDKITKDLFLERIVVGQMEVNCYLLADAHTKETVIIDPGAEFPKIKRVIDKNNLEPKFIINTHGHIDHIGVDDKFKVPVYIHRLDKDCLTDPNRNLSLFLDIPKSFSTPIKLLDDKEIIIWGSLNLLVIHTPGHTPGSISLKLDNLAFTGDTLFYGGIGRTDFPGASEESLLKSIRTKLLVLDDNTIVYPGHGPCSTIGQEKQRSPLLR